MSNTQAGDKSRWSVPRHLDLYYGGGWHRARGKVKQHRLEPLAQMSPGGYGAPTEEFVAARLSRRSQRTASVLREQFRD